MRPTTATTNAAGIVPAAPYTTAEPAYAYVGNGRWLPANKAAHEEIRRWNEYAAMVTARSAASRGVQQ